MADTNRWRGEWVWAVGDLRGVIGRQHPQRGVAVEHPRRVEVLQQDQQEIQGQQHNADGKEHPSVNEIDGAVHQLLQEPNARKGPVSQAGLGAPQIIMVYVKDDLETHGTQGGRQNVSRGPGPRRPTRRGPKVTQSECLTFKGQGYALRACATPCSWHGLCRGIAINKPRPDANTLQNWGCL